MMMINNVSNVGHGWLLSPFLQDIATFDTDLDESSRQKVFPSVPPSEMTAMLALTQRAAVQVPNVSIRAVLADMQGGVWIATESGLHYHTQEGALEITGKDGLP